MYEKLVDASDYVELDGSSHTRNNSTDTGPETLKVYNEDGTFKEVVIEDGLRVSHLCQLLALKNQVAKEMAWTLNIIDTDLGIERTVEDCEDVMTVHRQLLPRCRLVFRKDFRKYEMFKNPEQFFSTTMSEVAGVDNTDPTIRRHRLQTMVLEAKCPEFFGKLWLCENKKVWNKAFFVISDSVLYYSYKITDHRDISMMTPFLQLSSCDIYISVESAKHNFNAPTEFAICLNVQGRSQCLVCDSEHDRLCWLTALRLSKYGRQLLETYNSLKSQFSHHIDYSRMHDHMQSRVAMDFTGRCGRIIEDPIEIRAVSLQENSRLGLRRPVVGSLGFSVNTPNKSTPVGSPTSDGSPRTIHRDQPWYHHTVSRDEAADLLLQHASGLDGVFLLRPSTSKGSFVVSYLYNGKVHHTSIYEVEEKSTGQIHYTLDNGRSKFFDLIQLVEFYQLNTIGNNTRLTYYVIQSRRSPTKLSSSSRKIPFMPSSC